MALASRQGAAAPIDPTEGQSILESALTGANGVLLAVSGGPDSMALLGLARTLQGRLPLSAATVDHALRASSADEAALVASQAASFGLPHRTLLWTGRKPVSGLQEAAREARYALLVEEARRLGFSHIMTAHHADDQAETLLMRLAAGSGIAGLASMRPQTLREGLVLARPFLGIPKARLLATCKAGGLPFVDDPSNHDPRFGRARVRAALEALSAEGLTTARLARLAERAARADEALTRMAERALAEAGFRRTDCVVQADWTMLSTQPAEIRLRALAALLNADGMPPPRLDKLEALLTELDIAGADRLRLRRSIGDSLVTLQANGRLTITDAPPRRRGRPAIGTVLD